MIDGNIDVVSLTGQITQNVSLEGGLLPIGPKGDKGDPGFSPVVTTSKSDKTTTIKFETATGNVYAYIQDGEDGQGSGDMLTDVYDQNKNGIVDNAEKVNGKTVESNVPANAIFTDSNAIWGNITGTLSDQTDLQNALDDKANVSDIPTVNDATLTIQKNGETIDSFTANSSTNKTVNIVVPTKTSDLTNDANYVTSNGNATQSDEDTSLTFTNTLSAPMEIDLKGNTQQDTLSGKNKLPFTNQDFTLNNVRYYAQNGNLYLDGTSTGETGSTNSNFKNNFSFYLPAGTYILNSKKLDANQPMYIRNYATNDALAMINGNTIRTATFTLTETTQCYLSFYVYQKVFSNMNLEMQLEQGSTATSYEQYCGGIPSPNPDYPQDVNVVSGDNDVVVCGKNLFDNTYNDLGMYQTATGQIGTFAQGSQYLGAYCKVEAGKTYSISKSKLTSRFAVGTTKEIPTANTQCLALARNDSVNKIENITIPEGYSYLVLYLSNSSETSTGLNLQIEQGNQATTYEAYTGATYPINLPVKNIINIPDGTGTRENNTFTALNQEITLNSNISGTESAFYLNDVSQVSRYANSYSGARDYNMTSTGGTYTLTTYFSYKPENTLQIYLFTNKRVMMKSSRDNWQDGKLIHNITLDSDEYIKSVQCYVAASNVFDNLKMTAQLEEGSNTNAYHPYGATPIELCKIGTYQDYIYKDSGKWYLHKEIGKVVLDSNTNFKTIDVSVSSGNNNMAYVYTTLLDNLFKTNLGFNNSLTRSENHLTKNTNSNNEMFSISEEYAGLRFYFDKTRLSSVNVAGFRSWIGDNNQTIYYVLATPTNTEITDTTLIEQLEAIASATSYEGETNINQVNNDLPFIITAEVFNDNYNGRYYSLKAMYDKIYSGGNS